MRITKLTLMNWRNFKTAEVPLGDRLFVVGPECVGKSTQHGSPQRARPTAPRLDRAMNCHEQLKKRLSRCPTSPAAVSAASRLTAGEDVAVDSGGWRRRQRGRAPFLQFKGLCLVSTSPPPHPRPRCARSGNERGPSATPNTSPSLTALGWTPRWEPLLIEHAAGTPGRVLRHDGSAVLVGTQQDTSQYVLTPSVPALAVGDWVIVDGGRVVDLLPRASLLQRRDPSPVGANPSRRMSTSLASSAVWIGRSLPDGFNGSPHWRGTRGRHRS